MWFSNVHSWYWEVAKNLYFVYYNCIHYFSYKNVIGMYISALQALFNRSRISSPLGRKQLAICVLSMHMKVLVHNYKGIYVFFKKLQFLTNVEENQCQWCFSCSVRWILLIFRYHWISVFVVHSITIILSRNITPTMEYYSCEWEWEIWHQGDETSEGQQDWCRWSGHFPRWSNWQSFPMHEQLLTLQKKKWI